MNLLSLIIDRLNQRVATYNLFDQIYGLSELNQNGNEKAWINYIGDGQAQVVSDYDGANGTLFWAKRGRVTLSKNEQYNAVSCKQLYLTSIPLTAYAIVRKSSLPCDLADSVDFVANQIFKYVSGKDVDFKIATGLIQYDVVPASYGEETKSLSKNYEWACVTVDFNIEITSDSNDGCYAPCDNVPLPPYYPPTGSCCNIAIYDEGQIITESVTQIDFTGAGVTATSIGGAVTITITGGGSGNAEWGSIGTGTGISSQTDLVNYLLANFYPLLTNPSAFLVAADLLPYITSIDAALTYYPIPTGLTTDYIRGDGSIAAFPSVGSGTVTDFIFTDGNGFTGVVTTSTTTPTLSLTIQTASASQDGQLSSTDWSTFNGKFDVPTGTNTDYLDGTGTPTPFPTIPVVTGFVPYTGATADLDMGTHNVTADHIALNVSPSGAGFVVGATEWNNTIGSSQTLLKGGNVILKNGVDLVARIVNKVTPNTTLTKAAYQAVRVSGATGGRLSVELAMADTDNNSADTIGIVCETIATNQEGFIMTVGQLLDINTTGSLQGETWVDGDVLYLSPTTAGRLTNIKPTGATGHIVVMGYVEYSHPSNGAIYVKVMNGWELDELHNIFISSPANNDALIYESSTQLWKNKTIASAIDTSNDQFILASQIFS